MNKKKDDTTRIGVTLGIIFSVLFIIVFNVYRNRIIYEEVVKTEFIKYETVTETTKSLDFGVTKIKTAGEDGKKEVTYKIGRRLGNEVSREEIKFEVVRDPVNEVKLLGTKTYNGYCDVEGTYRNRYARCYGDYRESARIQAEEKAYNCNIHGYGYQGCYNRYR